MNLLKQSSKYNKYLDRINDYKLIADKNEAFSTLEVRVANLHQDLRTNNHKVFYNRIYKGLLGLSVILALCCFINGFTITGLLLIGSSIVSKYFYNTVLKNYIGISKAESEKLHDDSSFDVQLQHKMDYLQNGIDLKMHRIQIVRSSFMGIFALCMVAGLKLSNVPLEISVFVLSTIALMISGGFWFYFFKDDLDVLEYQDMELTEYIQVFESKFPSSASSKISLEDNHEATVNRSDSTIIHHDQDDQEDDDEFTEVVPPMSREKTIDDSYKQLSLDV